MATTGAERSRRTMTVSPFGSTVRRTVAGSMVARSSEAGIELVEGEAAVAQDGGMPKCETNEERGGRRGRRARRSARARVIDVDQRGATGCAPVGDMPGGIVPAGTVPAAGAQA